MSSEDLRLSNSFDKAVGPICTRAPQLSEVLLGKTAAPWSLSAFSQFLEKNFCSEVLQFTIDVIAYRECFESRIVQGGPLVCDKDVVETYDMWQRILETYVLPNGQKEINIPGAVQNELLAYQDPANPPSPTVLQPAYDMMIELMSGIYYHFVENVRPDSSVMISDNTSCAHTCSDDEGSMSMVSAEILPFYRRTNTLWGPSRVYRNVRCYNGFSNKTLPPSSEASPLYEKKDPMGKRGNSESSASRPQMRWSSSSPA